MTDPRRFESPATIADALAQARAWWDALAVRRVYADEEAVAIFHRWMTEFSLGRKRALDTMLAATYRSAAVTAIVSANSRDYRPFFETIAAP